MARKLCLQSLSHFLQRSLYFFLPRASRKNAHSLLRYLGIRGIADTSLPFTFFREVRKRLKPVSTVWFRGDFGRFHWTESDFPRRWHLPPIHFFKPAIVVPGYQKSTVLLRCISQYTGKWGFCCVHTYRDLNHPSFPVRTYAPIHHKSRLYRAWQLLQSP